MANPQSFIFPLTRMPGELSTSTHGSGHSLTRSDSESFGNASHDEHRASLKTFRCVVPGCNSRFTRKHSLKVHSLKLHRGQQSLFKEILKSDKSSKVGKRWGCPLSDCPCGYSRRGDLKTHFEKAHPRLLALFDDSRTCASGESMRQWVKEREHLFGRAESPRISRKPITANSSQAHFNGALHIPNDRKIGTSTVTVKVPGIGRITGVRRESAFQNVPLTSSPTHSSAAPSAFMEVRRTVPANGTYPSSPSHFSAVNGLARFGELPIQYNPENTVSLPSIHTILRDLPKLDENPSQPEMMGMDDPAQYRYGAYLQSGSAVPRMLYGYSNFSYKAPSYVNGLRC